MALRRQLRAYLEVDPERWQVELFGLILRATILLGFLVYLPSVYKALQSGLFGLVVFDTIAFAIIIGVQRYDRVSYRTRAAIYCLIFYGLAAALVVSVGSIGQIFLFGFSIMTALLHGLRAGLFSALLSSATLFAIGSLGYAAPPMLITNWHQGLFGWATITLNFSLVTALVTLAVGAVLSALDDALKRVKARTRDLVTTSERLQAILDASPVAIAGSDAFGIMNVWNNAAERLSGLKAADLIGRPIPDSLRDLSGEFGRKTDLIKQGEIISGIEVKRRFAGGRIVDHISSAAGIFDPGGAFLGIVTATMDVSAARQAQRDRDAAEALMRETERKYRTTLDLAPVGIIHTAPDGRFLMVNDFFCDLLGYTRPELLSLNVYAVTDPKDVEATRQRYQGALPAGAAIGTIAKRYRHRNGNTIWAEVISAAERDENGQVHHFMSIVNDTTARHLSEQRQLQLSAQLQQVQKMEAIGRLTGGMAHDFNNLLSVMLGNLDFLEAKFQSGSEELEATREAINAGWRGAELIQSLLAFARRQPLAPKLTNLADVLPAAARLLRRTLGEDITLDIQLDEVLWPVLIDVAQLESTILNLAVNARDAMPRGGTLTIEARNLSACEGAAEPNAQAASGDCVVISVSDTGIGMSADIVARVFEPFFTTKGAKGTGLGLSMVYGFVKQSGGHTSIHSGVGQGTTINIYLPRGADGATEIQEAPPPAVVTSVHRTILVVEDNKGLRNLVVRQLNNLGYHTLAAADSEAAMNLIRSNAVIDLLFTDVIMPGGMDGWALAQAGRAVRQDLKVLFTSGYTATAAVTANQFGAGLLTKPYRRNELAAHVESAINYVEPVGG